MPSHWGQPKLNIVSKSSCTGTPVRASRRRSRGHSLYQAAPRPSLKPKKAPLGEHVHHENDEMWYVSSGDGATSEGEFWESLNVACAKKLPLLYLIEDNG